MGPGERQDGENSAVFSFHGRFLWTQVNSGQDALGQILRLRQTIRVRVARGHAQAVTGVLGLMEKPPGPPRTGDASPDLT